MGDQLRAGPGDGGPRRAFSFKNGVKEIARREGLLASFMSKPFASSAGCGAHMHIEPARIDSGQNAMSRRRRGARFVQRWAAVHRGPAAARRFDLRSAGAHLELPQAAPPAHVQPDQHLVGSRGPLRAGADKGRFGARAATSRTGRPRVYRIPTWSGPRCSAADCSASSTSSSSSRPLHPPAEEDDSKPKLPTTLEESLGLLEADNRVTELLGEEFVKAYTVMRRHELQRFADHVTDWELQEYLEIY